MKIQPNCRVELDFAILDQDGDVVDSSEESGPLEFVQGTGDIPEALAAALEGKQVDDEVEVAFEAGEAFGEYTPDGIISVPRDDFPEGVELSPGEWIAITVAGDDDEENGEDDASGVLEMLVVEVDDEVVVLDANHPLSSEPVTFRVRVLSVSAQA